MFRARLGRRAASVYTEMNAISKGVAIGMYDESKKDGVEASKGGSQPYVDLMGRRYVAPIRCRLSGQN